MKDILEIFKEKFEVEEIDVKEFKNVKVGPMKFSIHCYDVKDIGRLSILNGKAMLGMMKMDTVMFTVFSKDVPAFSYDRIKAMGNDTLLFELYNTCKDDNISYPSLLSIKEKLKDVPVYKLDPCWYDAIRLKESVTVKGKKVTPLLDDVASEYLSEFCNIVKNSPNFNKEVKELLQKNYIDHLLSDSGSSTKMFIKYLGEEKTKELYHKYLFAI